MKLFAFALALTMVYRTVPRKPKFFINHNPTTHTMEVNYDY